MRNSYSSSQFNSLSEFENIKVTAVHEFFHSIQFDYNCYSFDHGLWFMEATAVWSEDELYNGINDLYRYMAAWFSNPDRPINDQSYNLVNMAKEFTSKLQEWNLNDNIKRVLLIGEGNHFCAGGDV